MMRPVLKSITRRGLATALLASSIALWVFAGPAPALAASSYLRLSTSYAPTNLPPGGKGSVIVTAVNLGDTVLGAGTVLVDKLPRSDRDEGERLSDQQSD